MGCQSCPCRGASSSITTYHSGRVTASHQRAPREVALISALPGSTQKRAREVGNGTISPIAHSLPFYVVRLPMWRLATSFQGGHRRQLQGHFEWGRREFSERSRRVSQKCIWSGPAKGGVNAGDPHGPCLEGLGLMAGVDWLVPCQCQLDPGVARVAERFARGRCDTRKKTWQLEALHGRGQPHAHHQPTPTPRRRKLCSTQEPPKKQHYEHGFSIGRQADP